MLVDDEVVGFLVSFLQLMLPYYLEARHLDEEDLLSDPDQDSVSEPSLLENHRMGHYLQFFSREQLPVDAVTLLLFLGADQDHVVGIDNHIH